MCTASTDVNETGVVGDDLTLRCNGTVTSEDSLNWWLYRRDLGLQDLRFYYRGEIDPDLSDKYIMQKVAYGYNLIIRNLNVDDAGTYVCMRSIDDKITFLVDVITKPTVQPSTSSDTDITG